jgi:hypothetical protein
MTFDRTARESHTQLNLNTHKMRHIRRVLVADHAASNGTLWSVEADSGWVRYSKEHTTALEDAVR